MWFPRLLGCIIIYVIAVNLIGIGWGWYRKDIMEGWTICVAAGSGGGLLMLAAAFAAWILMGTPTS
jgi:hypothetical protein